MYISIYIYNLLYVYIYIQSFSFSLLLDKKKKLQIKRTTHTPSMGARANDKRSCKRIRQSQSVEPFILLCFPLQIFSLSTYFVSSTIPLSFRPDEPDTTTSQSTQQTAYAARTRRTQGPTKKFCFTKFTNVSYLLSLVL